MTQTKPIVFASPFIITAVNVVVALWYCRHQKMVRQITWLELVGIIRGFNGANNITAIFASLPNFSALECVATMDINCINKPVD
jgi:hypothetical protein